MTKDMTQENKKIFYSEKFEQQNLLHRIKEIVTLPLFIITAAILSITVTDILSLPILNFVIKAPALFSKIVGITFLILLALFIISNIVSGIVLYFKSGINAADIFKNFIRERLNGLAVVMISLLVCLAACILLIMIFHKHSILIQSLM